MEVERLIADVYEAAVVPERRFDVLDGLATIADAQFATLAA